MKVITANLNGIRSANSKGFFSWLQTQNADVICLQELKAHQGDVQKLEILADYYPYFHFAKKKGYSGVAIYTRFKPKNVMYGLGWESADEEGRYVAIDLEKVWIASLYMPSGTSGEDRQNIK